MDEDRSEVVRSARGRPVRKVEVKVGRFLELGIKGTLINNRSSKPRTTPQARIERNVYRSSLAHDHHGMHPDLVSPVGFDAWKGECRQVWGFNTPRG